MIQVEQFVSGGVLVVHSDVFRHAGQPHTLLQ